MADKDSFYGIPVNDPRLLAELQKHKPTGTYFDPHPQALKGITALNVGPQQAGHAGVGIAHMGVLFLNLDAYMKLHLVALCQLT